MRLQTALSVALVLSLAGCASGGLLATARTVAPGKRQFALAAHGMLLPSGGRVQPGANVEAALRWGLSERIDLGLSASLLSGGAELRFQLVRSERVDVALGLGGAMTAQLLGGGDFAAVQAAAAMHLPLFVGINLGQHQLLLVPRVGYENWLGSGGLVGTHGLFLGGTLGAAFALTESFKLLPFVGLNRNVVWAFTTPPAFPVPPNHRELVVQAGLGFVVE